MNTSTEMPKYKCHKEVWALKIKDIGYHGRQRERYDRRSDYSSR